MNWTPQPFENERGILLFNGDVFDDTWNKKLSDTYIIMEKLANVSRIIYNNKYTYNNKNIY